jgi:ectoine hydroxylase-related dioxygenase (phytanoyl-CoA dioxygenase family)
MGPTELIRGSHLQLKHWTDEVAAASPNLLLSPALDGYYRGGSTIPAGSLLIFNTRCFHRTAPRGNRCDIPRDIVTNAYVRLQLSSCK